MDDWRAKYELQTDELAASFATRHTEYVIDREQPRERGLANCIVLGRRGEERVVFKRFAGDDRKKRERFALHYWEPTGLVPRLIDEDADFVIMSFLPGILLQDIIESVDIHMVGQQIGRSLERLIRVPLAGDVARNFATRPYSGTSLEEYFQRILKPSRLICEKASYYGDEAFLATIDFIETQIPFIVDQRRLIYNQDIRNMMFEGDEFRGFFDLESSWIGTEIMQIGSLWWIVRVAERKGSTGGALWRAFLESYGGARNRPLTDQETAAIRAFSKLLVWRDISSYGRWTGDEGHLLKTGVKRLPDTLKSLR